jgi:MOSC domain-containing protein YiiM
MRNDGRRSNEARKGCSFRGYSDRKENSLSAVNKTFGINLLSYEGVFCKVIKGGTIKKGDSIEVSDTITRVGGNLVGK